MVSVTIDISGLPAERILFSPSPLGELTAMLHVLAEPAHHPALHGWVTATAASLKPELADRLMDAEFLWRSSRADFLVPGQPGVTLGEELDAVDRIDDEVYVAAALVTTCGSSRLSFRARSPLADATERDRARDLAQARGPRQAAFAERLLADPPAVRSLVRRLLEDCEREFFADAWRRVHHHLVADARHKADLLARHGLAAALTAISPAITVDADLRRIVIDKLQDNATSADGDAVTFSPTAFGQPHLLVVHARGWRPVVQYPAAQPGQPYPISLEVMRQRLEALSHPVRIRLCRTLARGPHTTGELASAWQLSTPEVSRHLAVLKKAGLITSQRRGRYLLHELDLAAGARLGTDFLEAALR